MDDGGKVRVCELFAGIGGFRFGLEKTSHRFQTVYANEFDRFASSIYRYRWNDGTLEEADICTVKAEDTPDFDLLVGGFPCQPFSMAGKRKGTTEKRGQFFEEILRIVRIKRPEMLLLENVPGLLSIEGGGVFLDILRGLGNLGYVCEWQVFDSQFFGVPQQRRRLFIVGYLAALSRGGRTVFPLPQCGSNRTKKVIGENVSSTITASYGSKQNVGGNTFLIQPRHFKCEGDQLRVYEGKAPTLVAQMGMGGDNVPYVSGERLRRLTVVECERLQGFEDDWSRYGYSVKGETVEISVSQRYKAVGNAVTTNVIAVIGQLILNFLDQKEPN